MQIIVIKAQLKQVEEFKSLGSVVTSEAKLTRALKSRIALSKIAFISMTDLCNKKIKIETCLLYMCFPAIFGQFYSTGLILEPWRRKMWNDWKPRKLGFWNESKINYRLKKKSDEEVQVRIAVSCESTLMSTIKTKQLKFFGHVIWKGQLEDPALTGIIQGRNSPGRQRLGLLDQVKNWTNL